MAERIRLAISTETVLFPYGSVLIAASFAIFMSSAQGPHTSERSFNWPM
jgi:hypothetical protein